MQDKPRDGGVESKRREVCVCECVRAQSCLILCDPMDCSPPGFSVHGIFQAKYWSGVPLPSPVLSDKTSSATEV